MSTREFYILALVTYKLKWYDHGDFQDDGSGGYCSGGEGEEMEEQIVKQEKIIRIWKPEDNDDLKEYVFSDHNLKNLNYKIQMCSSDHASRYCENCFQEYEAIKIEYIKTLDIHPTKSGSIHKNNYHING